MSVQAFTLESLKINTGHYVAFERYDGAGNESPTLILLTGVNRGIDSRDLFINMLKRQKELTKNYEFQFIIETAPMIRFHESDPEGSQTAAICKNWLSLYPGFGSILSRTLLKQAYGQYWSAKVDKMISENPRYQQIPNFKNLMIQGYSQLSLAADNFDYRTQDFSKGPRRYFILGEDENPTPAKLQIEAIHKYEQQTEHKNSSIKLKHAGHIIPSDAPADYLEKILSVIKYEKLIK